MNNEKAFFDTLMALEEIETSAPLEPHEVMQLYRDVARRFPDRVQLFEFVRRIEQAHGIGVNYGRLKLK
jgi:hypothetical protein